MSTAIGQEAVRQIQTKVQRPWWPPVEPVGIAERLGIQVREAKFDPDILGALFMKPGLDPEIVLNREHSFLRRRLTCALETGHYVRMSATVDEYERADLYDGFEEVGEESDDEYARDFAGSLLMPKEDVKVFADLWMDDLEMALRFRVPRVEMRIRLRQLGLRVPELGAA